MVDCAWALRAAAAHYRMWAKQAEALNDNERYQSLKAKAKAKFREARRYVEWAHRRRAEMEAIRAHH